MVCGVHTPWDFAPNAYLLPMYLFVSTIMVVHSGPRRLFGIADWMRGTTVVWREFCPSSSSPNGCSTARGPSEK
jgi:hypothetical protein